MATYSSIIDNGLTSSEGFSKAISQLLIQGVASVGTPTSLQVIQRAAGANMSVDISVGSALIQNSTATFSYTVWQDGNPSNPNVAISASSPSNPRIDAVVAYINLAAYSTSQNNNPGSLVFTAITGTPASSPSAPTSSAIQAALTAGVPWILLANVTVPTSATNIVSADIADARPPFAVRARLWGGTSNTNGHTVPNVADDTVSLLNATQTFGAGKTLTSPAVISPTYSGTISGWVSASETWGYVSASAISVPSDATTKYDIGDYLQLTQSATVKYFIVTAVTSTQLTVSGMTPVTPETVANSTITLNSYSKSMNPHGLPGNTGSAYSAFTPSPTGFSGSPTVNIARYKQVGKIVFMDIDFSGTSNSTSCTFALPVGAKSNTNFMNLLIQDNTTFQNNPGHMQFTGGGSNNAAIFLNGAGGGFTASGTKGVSACGIVYEAA